MPGLRKRIRSLLNRCRPKARGFRVVSPAHNACAIKDAANGTHFAAYELNWNVMGRVNAANGTISAQYEYGPFGEVIRMTGSMAKLNAFRFSTKYQDDETDLLYYGYRYYSASLGRWLSRDLIGKDGGINVYSIAENDTMKKYDEIGKSVSPINSSITVVGAKGKRYTRGYVDKGFVVGTFQYPRKGECGCWERNVYVDSTPIYIESINTYRNTYDFQDDFSLEANMLETVATATDYFPETGKMTFKSTFLGADAIAGALATIMAKVQRKNDTTTWRVTQTYDQWEYDSSVRETSAPYFKNGESWKISDITCKPKYDIASEAEIRSLTSSVPMRFKSLPTIGLIVSTSTYTVQEF